MPIPAASLRRGILLTALFCVVCPLSGVAADDSTLSKEQITQFLLTAKVVNYRRSDKGITSPWRLTLSDGTITHDGSFQPIDEHKTNATFAMSSEINFVDSWKYNVAAYRLAELVGMDDMLPVYVERHWQGKTGSLSWWLPVQMDEVERHKRNLEPPDRDAWNKQMYKIRVFDELVYDTDPNLTNVLITNDWKLYRIDFSRAFRLSKDVQHPKDLVKCERTLFEKLKTLDGKELTQRTKNYLNKGEVEGVMARRDKIVNYFQKLIAEKGESEVLY